MTTTTDFQARSCAGSADAVDAVAGSTGRSGYNERVAALTAAYHRTVDAIMTERYGSDWATGGDLPDHAYTAETVFNQWLNDLLDHIDHAATIATSADGN
ncbi:hypothetical protein acdb102_16230 [Acidothermaceae bacterium B102]|nr:hypothetical protein acdb102_16230 [Acidothermaceae bacterium B102]